MYIAMPMNRSIFTCQSLTARHYSRGVNLIEIMVAMTIGLFLVLGATTLYVNSKKTADVDDATARLQETARYALSVLETEVRMANYWGLAKDGSNFGNSATQELVDDSDTGNPDTDDVSKALNSNTTGVKNCGDAFAYDVEKYIEASNNSYPLSCAAASPGALATADTLTVRRAATSVTTRDNNKLQICANRNHLSLLASSAMTCDAGNEIHDLITNTYYIDRGSDQSSSYPSLRRKQLVGGLTITDQEIIPGVEDMQVQLGWAPPNSQGYPTSDAVMYLQPGNAALAQSGSQIIAVRVWLLIRAETSDSTFTDSKIYTYAGRTTTPVTADLTSTTDATKQYAPQDHFRRLLVSRTFFVRNAVGT